MSVSQVQVIPEQIKACYTNGEEHILIHMKIFVIFKIDGT